MNSVNRAIFKAYDIRGLSPGDIDASLAERVGRAVVLHTNARRVVVGRDMRATSPELAAAVIRGVTAQGADAIDIGLATTPMFNFAVASDAVVPAHSERFGTPREEGMAVAGIMVTASHNPAKDNGFKMDDGTALPIGAETGMPHIAQLVQDGVFHSAVIGTVKTASCLDAYLARVTALLDPATLPPTRMVVCCGNGMGGYTMPRLAPLIPGEVIPLHWELDGNFPNHEANPIKPENVRDVGAAVRDAGAQVGFAYDGDADRLGVIDERGDLVRGDFVAILLAREELRERPHAHILCDVRASRTCAESIALSGGTSEVTRVGHALIKKHLRDVGAVFAGELSGHFYFDRFYGVECTELVMLMVLRILGRERRPLSEIVAPFVRYAYSGEVNFTVEDKISIIRTLEERYGSRARSVLRIDGCKFDMGDWWFLVRASNTEPLLRLIVEAPTTREMEARVAEIGNMIHGK